MTLSKKYIVFYTICNNAATFLSEVLRAGERL